MHKQEMQLSIFLKGEGWERGVEDRYMCFGCCAGNILLVEEICQIFSVPRLHRSESSRGLGDKEFGNKGVLHVGI